MISLSAFSVSKMGLDIKTSICSINIKKNNSSIFLPLVTKINEDFVKFKLLDILVLDKIFILTAIGSEFICEIINTIFNPFFFSFFLKI